MARDEVKRLVKRLYDAQQVTTDRILASASFETLKHEVPDHDPVGPNPSHFTVTDVLRMWVWHFTTHYRNLIRARGSLKGDNPHFHVPHFVRQAHEELGKFVGELECLTDEQLDLYPPGGGFTIRETVEHVLGTLEGYFPSQVEQAKPKEDANP
jgi:hypothetical protein